MPGAFEMRKVLIAVAGLAMAGGLTEALAEGYDRGCVSCHVEAEPDFRVNALLAKVLHRNGPERTVDVPAGCNRCHAADDSGSGEPLRKLIHSIHYEVPEENPFMTQYGGDCRSCHSMNGPMGKAITKDGERNWTLPDTPSVIAAFPPKPGPRPLPGR